MFFRQRNHKLIRVENLQLLDSLLFNDSVICAAGLLGGTPKVIQNASGFGSNVILL